jgi:hypothetical protein
VTKITTITRGHRSCCSRHRREIERDREGDTRRGRKANRDRGGGEDTGGDRGAKDTGGDRGAGAGQHSDKDHYHHKRP